MAIFFPGASKCAITGRTLGGGDEVAFVSVFSHPDPAIERCSDGVIDFAAVRRRPEFQTLVTLYEAFIEGKEPVFKSTDGAVVRLRYGQVEFVFFPLLLSISAPESSVRNLFMSDFSETSLSSGKGKFEDYGLGLDYAAEQLTIQFGPTKYLPSRASPKLVHRLIRKGEPVEPFLKFCCSVLPN
jgi:hypothetical protein